MPYKYFTEKFLGLQDLETENDAVFFSEYNCF